MNMFPLIVTTPDGTAWKSCRLVSDGRDLRVWHWTGSEYVIVAEAPAAELAGAGPAWSLADGTQLVRQDGCGCGHPLKHYTPTTEAAGARRVYASPET